MDDPNSQDSLDFNDSFSPSPFDPSWDNVLVESKNKKDKDSDDDLELMFGSFICFF